MLLLLRYGMNCFGLDGSSWQHIGIYLSTYFLLLLCLNCKTAKLFIMVLCSSSSIFPGPFVHRLVVGLHTDFALHLDWFDSRDSDLVTKVGPDLSFDCGVGLQDCPEQLCILLPSIPSVPFQDLQD